MKQHPDAWKFYRCYANLPMPLRSSEIVAVVDNEPLTFQVIKLELDNHTEVGNKAVDNMVNMGIL